MQPPAPGVVTWYKHELRWAARYNDANGKGRHIGFFDTQEAAAHAVNAAIRRAGLEGKAAATILAAHIVCA